jgi:AAHS family 3-hydroxyphenylpropionic acid transporter
MVDLHMTHVRKDAAMTVLLCFAVAVLEGFDIQALGVAAPALAPEFGLTPRQMGWLFSVGNLGIVIGAVCGGSPADRVGRRPVLIAAVVVFGTFSFAMALVSHFTSLLAVRFVAGLGFGAALPNMMAMAADAATPSRRASAAAAMFSGMPLGGAALALLTQLVPVNTDWRVLFFIGGLLPLALVPVLYLWLAETLSLDASRKTVRKNYRRALFAEDRAGPTLLLWLAFLPTLLILYLILNWLPTLVTGKGIDRSLAPQAALAFNVAGAAGALLLGRAVDAWGFRWTLVLTYAALAATLAALGMARGLPAIVGLSAAAGFLLLGANYSLYGVAAAYYPADVRGAGCGASIAMGRVGAVIGPMLAGMFLDRGLPATSLIQFMGVTAGAAGLAVLALGRFRSSS